MNNAWRTITASLLTATGLALLWGGMSQARPDSLYLYAAGAVLLINAVGIFLGRGWVRLTWPLALLGSLWYAAWFGGQPFRNPELFGPVSLRMAPLFVIAATPLLLACAVQYFLPSLLAKKK